MSNWYVQLMGETVGPITGKELRERAQDGQITAETLVAKDSTDHWVTADKVTGLIEHSAPTEEPPIPAVRVEPMAAKSSTEGTSSPMRREMPNISLVLSIVAICISLGSAAWSLFQSSNPAGSRIDTYDFSSPEKSLASEMDMLINGDYALESDYYRLATIGRVLEKRNTYKVNRVSVYQGKKILFVSYKSKGVRKQIIQSYEKDSKSGFWLPKSEGYDFDVDDKALATAIRDWKRQVDPVDELETAKAELERERFELDQAKLEAELQSIKDEAEQAAKAELAAEAQHQESLEEARKQQIEAEYLLLTSSDKQLIKQIEAEMQAGEFPSSLDRHSPSRRQSTIDLILRSPASDTLTPLYVQLIENLKIDRNVGVKEAADFLEMSEETRASFYINNPATARWAMARAAKNLMKYPDEPLNESTLFYIEEFPVLQNKAMQIVKDGLKKKDAP